VKNEGMPIFNKDEPLQNLLYDNIKGNLYIKFDVVFPKFIEPDRKEEIIRILQENN
jgi:DnaJ-class molecular chaperone